MTMRTMQPKGYILVNRKHNRGRHQGQAKGRSNRIYLMNRLDSNISITSVTGETPKSAAARGRMFFPKEPEGAIMCE